MLPLTLAGKDAGRGVVRRGGRRRSAWATGSNNLPSQLSGGQQQRVAVARALVPRPDIVFADEPTGALDSRTGIEILTFMRRAVDESGQTIVMVTHDPHAASYADNVLFLADGQIIDEMPESDHGPGPRPDEAVRGLTAVLKLALRGVRHNVGRYVATLVAIITGVAFFTATGFLSDRVINALEGDVDRQYGNVDVGHRRRRPTTTRRLDFAEQLAHRRRRRRPDRRAARRRGASAASSPGRSRSSAPTARPFGDGATGRLWIADDELNPIDIADGRGAGRRRRDRRRQGAGRREDLAVGDDRRRAHAGRPSEARRSSGSRSSATPTPIDQGGTVSIPDADAFDWLNSGQRRVPGRCTCGAPAASRSSPTPSPRSSRAGSRPRPATSSCDDQSAEAGSFGKVLKNALQGFALLALFVGGFVIYNTFSVIVAQRLRELAVLAAIGATPKQLKRSLRFEGILIGLIGSALGVVVGFGLAFVLIAVLGVVGVSLPGSGISVTRTVVVQGSCSARSSPPVGHDPGPARRHDRADRGAARGGGRDRRRHGSAGSSSLRS